MQLHARWCDALLVVAPDRWVAMDEIEHRSRSATIQPSASGRRDGGVACCAFSCANLRGAFWGVYMQSIFGLTVREYLSSAAVGALLAALAPSPAHATTIVA